MTGEPAELPPAIEPEGPEDDRPMSFFEHLAELRGRIMRASLGLLAGFVLCWTFVEELNVLLHRPLREAWLAAELPGQPQLQVLGVFDAFMTNVRIAVTGAVFVAAPLIFYQLWRFVSPGLYRREKRWVVPFVGCSAVMFVAGAWFCYALVLPFATQWFLEYPRQTAVEGSVAIVPQYTFPEYITYTTKLLLAFGIMAEFPLLIFFLAAVGLVTHRTLLRHWRISVLIIFLVSAVLTPPDPITLLFMAIPMCVLFFGSVGVAYVASRSHREAEARAAG